MAKQRRKSASGPVSRKEAVRPQPRPLAASRRERRARPAVAGTTLLGVVACFLLSGFAALLYQTAWLRQLSQVFGTSELAVAAVLAAYMAGLAGGAAAAARFVDRIRRPILVYGGLEAGIALSALAVPALLALAGSLYGWAFGGRPEPPDAASLGQPIFHLAVAFLVLFVPTGLMGATLPLLTRQAVSSDREVGPRVALLYASNTAGAVLGTVTTGFLLLPALGLNRTVWVGVAVNGLVFAIAATLARSAPAIASGAKAGALDAATEPPIGFLRSCVAPLVAGAAPASERVREVFRAQAAWILPSMLASGAVAFVYEVLWTRLLAHVLGGSVSAFATMLAAFLTGIALGGGLAGRLATHRERAALAFAASQIGIAALSIAVYAWMGALIPEDRQQASQVLYAIAVMVPATICIGATFPLAVRILSRDERDAGGVAARVYAWNTVGAIAGATLAGFWLVPELGFEGTLKLAVCVNLGLAALSLACVAEPRPARLGAVALALLGVLLLYHPSRPRALISHPAFHVDFSEPPREKFYAVGRSSTVLLLEVAGRHRLFSNGLPEASIAGRGSPPSLDVQKWLTALAVLARPDTESMLVIGFGGGATLEGVPPSVGQIDVVEIEPEVIEANRRVASSRDYDPLRDPRVRVVVNDARNALRLTSKRYAAIVSQPSHPWTAGASHLFTREYFRSAKEHLQPGGVFVQWMNSEFLTEPLLRSFVATLLAEFQEVRLYRPFSSALVFLASDAPLAVELELARTRRPLRDDPLHYARLGIASVEDLLTVLAMERDGLEEFSRGAPLVTDDRNAMATDSRSRADGLTPKQVARQVAPFDPLTDPNGWIHAELGRSLDFVYLARRINALARTWRTRALAPLVRDDSMRHLIEAELAARSGDPQRARESEQAALAADPRNQHARFLVVRREFAALSGAGGSEAARAAATGLEGPALAVLRGWRASLARDWRALAALESELARSRPTDPWYADAVALRAQQRLKLHRSEPDRVRDALRLIDAALVANQELNLYTQRAVAGIALGDRNVFVESAGGIVKSVVSRLDQAAKSGAPLEPSERAGLRENLTGLARELGKKLSHEDGDRAHTVRAAAVRAIARIDASAAGTPAAREAARPTR